MSQGAVLVVDPHGEWYVERLSETLPEASLEWATSFAQAGPRLTSARALITMGVAPLGLALTDEILAQMPRLEWVQGLLAGHEHLASALAARPEVVLTSVRGVHGPQMTETVLSHMLVLTRGIKRQIINQQEHRWDPWPQPMLEGRSVGIVGMGASGRHIARACKALGMTVYGVSRTAREAEGVDRLFDRTQLAEAAAQVDFLVLVLAAEPGADKLVDADVLRAMNPAAFLINVARGSVVDEQALADALRAGEIAGAGLDVFTVEPLPDDSPLWDMDNVVVTPHLGGRSDRMREQTLAVVEPNLRAFVAGRKDEMVNVVAR